MIKNEKGITMITLTIAIIILVIITNILIFNARDGVYVKNLENIIPTTQAKPTGLLENYGGFTDGDRAVHIAIYALGINDITMAGMDFGSIITQYSRPNIATPQAIADEFKKKKLDYANKLIKSLNDNNQDVKIVNLVDIL